MTTEIKLPELGENIESAEVLSVLVNAGDRVEKDQPLIELETDKATAEVPSETAGVVKEVRVKQGDAISVGQIILILDAEGAGGDAAANEDEETATASKTAEAKASREEPETAPAGSEPEPRPEPEAEADAEPPAGSGNGKRTPPRERETEAPARGHPPEPTRVREPVRPLKLVDSDREVVGAIGDVAPAAPSVRRLARELGIDVTRVPGSGPGGRISEDDVKAFARRLLSHTRGAPLTAAAPAPGGGPAVPDLPDFSDWGETEREPATKVRRVTAQTMSLSWNVIPHVTQFDRADITELEAWRKRYGGKVERAGAKLTVTAIAVKVLAGALKVFPRFNASYDARNEEMVLKHYVNVGVAVDTERGLLVPVLRDVDRKNITEIAVELEDLADRARSRKIKAEELQGGNINLSNLGGLGTTYFSPIVAWPQVAVLGVGRAEVQAVHTDGEFVPRLILPLAVSYDHRAVDGADAARFLRWIAEALEQPLLIALEG